MTVLIVLLSISVICASIATIGNIIAYRNMSKIINEIENNQ